jgi:2-dehydropantoate 2-reductase
MKMAVYGAGSLGTILGALLTKGGYDIDLIDVNQAHVKALNEKGAKIVGLMELEQPVKALTPDEMTEPYDLIFYLTKSTHDASSLPYVTKYLKPDGILVTGQNGMPEQNLNDIVGKERVIGQITGWGATWLEPGVSKLTSPADHMIFEIGEQDGRITKRLQTIAGILRSAGKVNMVTNLIGMRWAKWTSNCSFSGMSAIVAGPFGDVLDHPHAIRCAIHIMNESMAIAKAAGVTVEKFQEAEFDKYTFTTEKELEEHLPAFIASEIHRDIRTGMLYDMEAGRYPEIDTTYNGMQCTLGYKYGVPTPVNQQVATLVHAMAAGKLKIDPSNVDLIVLPKLPAK